MTTQIYYPFRLDNAFFVSIEIKRMPVIPENSPFNFTGEIKIVDEKYPEQLQINIKLLTPKDQPISFDLELIAIYKLIESEPKPDRDIINDFVSNRAVFMLWPYVAQIVTQITAQMGMNPLKIPTPYEYKIEFQKEEK